MQRHIGGEAAADEAGEVSARRLLLTVFSPIMLPIFLAVMDQTIVAAALPAMAASLGAVERISWVVLGYLVANTVAAPVYGRLGDVFGRRRLMLVGLVIFIVASVLCALAGSIVTLTLARVLQGLGGGGLMVQAQALIGENVPARQRGRYQGYLAAVIVCASMFGPVAGGVLTQSFGWPSVFLVNVPLGLLAMALAMRLPSSAGSRERLRFDTPGLLLFAGFIVPLLLGLEQVQHFDAAAVPEMAGFFGAAALCLVLFIVREQRAPQPLMSLRLLRMPGVWRSAVMAACSGGLLVSEVTFVPIYLHVVHGASPGQIGVLILPLAATVGVGSLITGQLVSRTGRTALFPSIGQPVTCVTLGIIAVGIGHFSLWGLPAVLAFAAIFQGSAMPVAQITAQAEAGAGMLGAAAAAVQLARSVGSAIGVALVGAALFAALARADAATAALFAEMVTHGPAAMDALPAARQAVVQGQVTAAFGVAFAVIAAFAGVSGVLAWTLPVRRI
ncbi:MAG TPA: MFS transporter [Acetobacteraceae bacterium]